MSKHEYENKKSKWGLAMSGASVRIGILYSFLVEVWSDHNFKVIAGTSSGGLLALVAATGNIEKAYSTIVGFKITDIFKENPFTVWGRLMMCWRVLVLNKNYLQDQSRLVDTIKSVISEDSFLRWQHSVNAVEVYVNTVNPETKEEHWIMLNNLTYEEAINEALMATASIPVMTAPVWIKFLNIFGYDGGWRSHIGSHFLSKKHGHELEGIYSLLSRVENVEDYPKWRLTAYKSGWKDWLFVGSFVINIFSTLRHVFDTVMYSLLGWEMSVINNWVLIISILTNIWFLYNRGFAIFDIVMRLFDVFNHQISEDDISNADYECHINNLHHVKIYSPKELMSTGIYKITPEQQQKNYDIGKAHANKVLSDYWNSELGIKDSDGI